MNSNQFKILFLVQIITLFLVGMLFIRQPKSDSGKPMSDSGQKAIAKNSVVSVRYSDKFIYGKADAKNELVIFSRYSCGFCRDFYNEEFDTLLTNYVNTGKLKIVFMNFVNPADKKAMLMAKVTEAGISLNKYVELQKLFYAESPEDSLAIVAAAIKTGIDEDNLKKELANPKVMESIMQDNSEGDRLHITGTPTFILNGNVFVGYKGYEAFNTSLKELMKP
jgi:protein-disulfide isomerase